MSKVAVINSDGRRGFVPIDRLNDALSKGGYQLADPTQKISVVNSNGKNGYVPAARLNDALTKGGYQLSTPNTRPAQSNIGVAGRSFLKGTTSIADAPQALAQFAANANRDSGAYGMSMEDLLGGDEYIPTPEISLGRPITDIARSGIKNVTGYDLEPNPTTPFQNFIDKSAGFAGGIFGLNSAGAALKGGANLANVGRGVGTGAAIGGASGLAQEAGANPLVADIASSVIMPSTIGKTKGLFNAVKHPLETATKVGHKITGIGPKSLNMEAARAARDLDIDLPSDVLTNSKFSSLTNQFLGKAPFTGDMISKKYINADKQIENALENIYKDIGPRKTPEITREINKRYKKAVKSLPEGATVKPTHTLDALKGIKIKTALPSPQEKDLAKSLKELGVELNPKLNKKYGIPSKEFGEIKLPTQDFDMETLIGTKRSLNSQIKWDTEEGVKEQLKTILGGVKKDITEYGKTNPDWHKKYKEADKLYGDVAKSANVRRLLDGKGKNYATDSLQHNALSKTIHNPETAEYLRKRTTPEVFARIEKLGKVSRALTINNKNIPNPSGTAPVSKLLGITGAALGGSISLPLTAATAGGAVAYTKLLTDKKFIDLALKYAETGGKNKLTAMALNTRIKNLTGYTATSLNNELQRLKEKEDKK